MSRFFAMLRNISNWPQYLVFKYFNGGSPHFTFLTRSGLSIKVPKRMLQTFKESFYDEAYLKGFPAAFSRVPPGPVVDIGANVGYFTLYILTKFPSAKVIAYEPMPNNFSLLKEYKNAFSTLNLTIHNKAVSNSDGVIMLNYDASDTFTTSATIFNKKGENDVIKVATVSLETAIKENNLDGIGLLKLDCEGAEYPILYSSSSSVLSRIRAMAIETHQGSGEKENMESLAVFLQQNGFSVKTSRDVGSGFIWAWR